MSSDREANEDRQYGIIRPAAREAQRHEIDKAHLAEALAQLKHAARDWQNLNGEERHGTIHNAIHELEEAINVE